MIEISASFLEADGIGMYATTLPTTVNFCKENRHKNENPRDLACQITGE
jgi:hypothetical protein